MGQLSLPFNAALFKPAKISKFRVELGDICNGRNFAKQRRSSIECLKEKTLLFRFLLSNKILDNRGKIACPGFSSSKTSASCH